jgi:hypothetical protein
MRRSLCLTAALFLSLLAAPAAEAGFAPTSESIVTGIEINSELAVGPDGAALVTWGERPVIGGADFTKARWLSPSGDLGPVVDLTPGGPAAQPAVGVGPAGRGFVAWRSSIGFDPSTVEGRWVERDGSLGPILTIATPSAEIDPVELRVVVDPAGVATVGWRNEGPNSLGLRRVGPDGSLSTLLPDVAPGSGVNEVRLAAMPSGGTLVVWAGTGIMKNFVAPDLSIGTPETISTVPVAWPELASDAQGRSLVVWRQPGSEPYSVRGRVLDASGNAAGGELTIDPNGEGFLSVRPSVAADSAGNFLAVWDRKVDGIYVTFARRVDASGAFAGPAQAISDPAQGESGRSKAVLLDNGTGIVTWENELSGVGSVLGRTVDPLAVPSAPAQFLVDAGTPEVASVPAAGYATVLSDDFDAASVRRYLEPPGCAPASAVLRSRAGVEVRFDCKGLGIESGTALKAPRFGTLGPLDPAKMATAYKPKPGKGGNDSFTYSLASDGGSSGAVEVRISDRLKPVVKKVRLVAKGGAYKLKVKASEPVRVKVKAKGGGKAKSKRFAARTTIRLRGKLKRRLAAGRRVRVKVSATDRAGNRSRPKKARL